MQLVWNPALLTSITLPPNVYGRTWTPTRMQAFSSGGSAQCGQAQSYIRPLDCGASLLPRARMEMRGSGPNRARELGSSFHTTGFPDPVSLTVCPYSSSDLLTFLPALFIRLPLRRPALAPGKYLYSSSAPRRCAPSCWRAPPRPPFSVCGPASGPAMSFLAHRAAPPSAPPTSRP